MSDNSFKAIIVAGIAAIILYFGGFNIGGGIIPKPNPDPDPNIEFFPIPEDKYKDSLPNVSDHISGQQALDLAHFFRNYAYELKHGKWITTSEQASKVLENIGEIFESRTNVNFDYPHVADIIEKYVLLHINKNKVLDSSDREMLFDIFMSVAWKFYEASGLENFSLESENLDILKHGCILEYVKDDEKFLSELHSFYGVPRPIIIDDDNSKKKTFEDKSSQPTLPEYLTNGLITDQTELTQFKQQSTKFSQFGLRDSGKGKTRLLFPSYLKFDSNAFSEKQTTGDCTSHGARNAVDVVRALEIDILHEPESFIARGATEGIYGARGHAGQGMSIVAAMRFINEDGGIAVRKKYDDINIDLSTYNSKIGAQWGRSGTPQPFKDILDDNQVGKIAYIGSVDEARDALFSGFPIVCGSNHSFSARRDNYGIAARTPEGWSHCMAWIAVATIGDLTDDTIKGDEPCFLVVNSWGKWNAGPTGKYLIPSGSFWIRSKDAATMIKQDQTFAIGNCQGFAPLPLTSFGLEWLRK